VDKRLRPLNDAPIQASGRYVLYWMQHAQRADYNHALEFAIREARRLKQTVLVVMGLLDGESQFNERHFSFVLQGLAETSEALAARGIKLIVRLAEPLAAAEEVGRDASLVVCDCGYLAGAARNAETLGRGLDKRVVQVETNVVVPVAVASEKAEYAARTIRPKLQKQWPNFLRAVRSQDPSKSSLYLSVVSDLDLSDVDAALCCIDTDRSVARSTRFQGGATQARTHLQRFIRSRLPGYADQRNDPASPVASLLSPYLRYGQISPVEVARKVRAARSGSEEDKAAFLEELIVRRELAVNFVYYTREYQRFGALPEWARVTLDEHRKDKRPQRYTAAELEAAETSDPYWNAAMLEMLKTGYMHNQMRMYWGKKILEWSNTPEYAFRTALHLNNKYFIDGRDPSSFANVAWIFGLHDQAWQERPVFGKVRYMNAKGLQRKFDIDAYCEWVASL